MLLFQVDKYYKITFIDGINTYKINCKILEVRKKDIVIIWEHFGKSWRSRLFNIDIQIENNWIKYENIIECKEL